MELKIKKLNFKFKKKYILKDIDLYIKPGITAILGPNGAGKSTLMRILATVLPFNEGDIFLGSNNYKECDEKIKYELSYLPQDFYIYPMLTGKEFLELIFNIKNGRNKGASKNDIDNIIKKLNIMEYQNKKIKTYSGGIRRRLGIAQLLLGESKLIIIDEPTNGLDMNSKSEFKDIIDSLDKGKIILISTHSIEDIELVCKSIIIIIDGQVSFYGLKEELIESAKGEIWSESVDMITFDKLRKEHKVLSSNMIGDVINVKYISENRRNNNSILVSPNLKEAYECHLYKNSVNKYI